jgi:hypothetical protein
MTPEFTKKEIPMSKKTLFAVLGGAAAALALAAPAAHAGPSVHLSIGVPLYGGYYAPPAYVVTGPRYVYPQAYYYGGHRYYGHRSIRHDRDRDGDGVPNRWDRRPGNWRR